MFLAVRCFRPGCGCYWNDLGWIGMERVVGLTAQLLDVKFCDTGANILFD